jgi:hypothetical protein
LQVPESDEKGVERKLKATFPVAGTLTLDGRPLPGAAVAFHAYNKKEQRYTRVADGRSDDTGRFTVTTYAKFDGAPAGEYTVTVAEVQKGPIGEAPPLKGAVPEQYATPAKSPLKIKIAEGKNEVNLDLKSK